MMLKIGSNLKNFCLYFAYKLSTVPRNTVKSEIKAAPQKFVIPKEKALLCLFSFGITNFWGVAFILAVTVT